MGEELKFFLESNAGLIDARLKGVMGLKEQAIEKIEADILVKDLYGEVVKILGSYVAGGKKVRGSMVMLGYELAGKDRKEALDVAVAIELMHSFLLIQDDIMDKDELRRGSPTLHIQLKNWAERQNFPEADHYGKSVAMTVSDLLQFWASELFLGCEIGVVNKLRAWRYWVGILEQTAWGQLQDISYERLENLEEDKILAMHEWKTGVYTISGPLAVGGLLGGLEEETLKAINYYGKKIGVAFQLMDDDLGIFGKVEVSGKDNGGDVKLNKQTLLRKRLFTSVDSKERVWLESVYGNSEIGDKELSRVRKLLEKTGSRLYAQQKAVEFCEQGREIIGDITDKQKLQVILGQLADYVVSREK